jgi:phenylacetate-CoA ligase
MNFKNIIRNTIYSKIPIKIKIGYRYYRTIKFLEKTEKWNDDKIIKWQTKRIKSIIIHAYKNVPGYTQLFSEAGVNPEKFKNIEDLKEYPFITKDILRDNIKMFTWRPNTKRNKIYCTTSGSTGIPFGFYHDKHSDSLENAFMHYGWKKIGWELGKNTAILRGGYTGSKSRLWNYDDAWKELHMSSYYLTSENVFDYVNISSKYKIKYLQSYPSVASLFSQYILENKLKEKVEYDIILLGSESIYHDQLRIIQNAFPHSKIYGWYGQSERVILAQWKTNKNI